MVIKSHFRGNCDLWWSVGFPFYIPSLGPGDTGVFQVQSSPGMLAPRQEFSGGGESTKGVATDNNGDDRSVLKLRNDGWRRLRPIPASSPEHHSGRVGEEVRAFCRNLKVKRSLDPGPSVDRDDVAYVGDEQGV